MPDATLAPPRAFTQFLHEQRRGALHDELSEQLAVVVAAVTEHGKQGTVTLTLKIKPAGDGMVQVFDALATKAPEGNKEPSIFWADENGNLGRNNPRQNELPLRDAARTAVA